MVYARRPRRRLPARRPRRAFRRRRPMRRPARATRLLANAADPSVRILNPLRPRSARVQKTISETLTYGQNITGVTPLYAFIFDPSGTYGNASTAGTGLAMPDWSSYAAIYDQYRVNSITLVFRFHDVTAGATIQFPLWIRYNYDFAVSVPTMTGAMQLSRVMQKEFSAEHLVQKYKFYPKVAIVQENGAIFSSSSLKVTKQGWTDVDRPCELWGIQFASDQALTGNQHIYFSIIYDVSFRYTR